MDIDVKYEGRVYSFVWNNQGHMDIKESQTKDFFKLPVLVQFELADQAYYMFMEEMIKEHGFLGG